MPDFDKLQKEVEGLLELLKAREEGLGTWCLFVGQRWKAIHEMWTGRSTGLDFSTLVAQSVARAMKWHPESTGGLHNWSELEWAGAMAGEAGECCNNAKKLRRVQLGMVGQDELENNLANLKLKTAKEAADTLLYAVLVIHICGHDPEEIIRAVYNNKSIELGFPERL